MIISHKYQYIFIKTRKVAGTSVEIYLNKYRGPEDVFTPIASMHENHTSQNYKGSINPVKELLETRFKHVRQTYRDYKKNRKYWNHLPGLLIKSRIEPEIWNNYYKFTIERNPWDKTASHYYWLKRNNEELTFKNYLKDGFLPNDYDKYTNLNGELIVDRVIRYENLNEDLGEIFSKLDIPYDGELGIFSKSSFRKNRDYSQLYDKEDRQFVANVFSKEINLFGYQF